MNLKDLKAEIAATLRPLAEASTLAPQFYVDPQIYALESEQMFRASWISIGRVDQIAKPGDYFAYDVMGVRVVAVRVPNGRIRVMSATCRHRAMTVVTGCGNANSFQCPYHLWTYGLDGHLLGSPEMDRAKNFNSAEYFAARDSVRNLGGLDLLKSRLRHVPAGGSRLESRAAGEANFLRASAGMPPGPPSPDR